MENPPNRLRSLREGAGLTQEQVADRLGVSKMTVSFHENGHRELTSLLMDRYCKLYKVKPRQLYVEDRELASATA